MSGDGVPVVIPVTGELDLHTFAPKDVPSVVEDYVNACLERGLSHVRFVHGRGKGVQRAAVRRVLQRLEGVVYFCDAGSDAGGWGATLVTLASGADAHGKEI